MHVPLFSLIDIPKIATISVRLCGGFSALDLGARTRVRFASLRTEVHYSCSGLEFAKRWTTLMVFGCTLFLVCITRRDLLIQPDRVRMFFRSIPRMMRACDENPGDLSDLPDGLEHLLPDPPLTYVNCSLSSHGAGRFSLWSRCPGLNRRPRHYQ